MQEYNFHLRLLQVKLLVNKENGEACAMKEVKDWLMFVKRLMLLLHILYHIHCVHWPCI